METNKDGEMETVAGGLPLPIPEGPFFDVLSRLSIKDLHRHTCLSSWRDFFINFPDSRKKLPQTLQGFFYISYDYKRHGHGGDDGDSDDGNGGGTYGDDDSVNNDNGSTGGSDTDQDGDGSSKSNGDSGGGGGGSDTGEDGDGSGNSNGGGSDADEDGDGSGNSYSLHFLDLLAKSMPVPDDTDTKLDFITLPPDIDNINLLCSCNGLLLFGCRHDASKNYYSMSYIVCNPATKQWKAVPSSGWILTHEENSDKSCEKFESTFLFFDPAVPSRFLLIQFWHDEDATLNLIGDEGGVYIYSSETGEWSNRSSEWMQFAKEGEWGDKSGVTVPSCMGSSFVNGKLHFFVKRVQQRDVLVVAIDGEGRIRRTIRWPLDRFTKAVFIGQSQGRLHCISANFIHENEDQKYKIIMSVDVLQDYDAEQWISKFDIWGGDLSGGKECRREHYEVVAFHPDGNLVYIVDHRKGELIQYDMGGNYPENEQVLRLCTLGHSCEDVTPYVPCFSRIMLPVL